METRLIAYSLGVVALVAGSLTAMADQSGRLIDVHEVPPFIAERIELPPSVPVTGGRTGSDIPALAALPGAGS